MPSLFFDSLSVFLILVTVAMIGTTRGIALSRVFLQAAELHQQRGRKWNIVDRAVRTRAVVTAASTRTAIRAAGGIDLVRQLIATVIRTETAAVDVDATTMMDRRRRGE